jgi:glycosyltransferase involved in cell wall biosynthesis
VNKILVLATEYPTYDNPHGFTPVVHYFTKHWVEMGHEVIVVHNLVIYPRIFYIVGRVFKQTIESLTGSNFSTSREINDKIYSLDGVKVLRFPIFKLFPKYRFSEKVIDSQLSKIITFCSENHFIPDIIIGHFTNPQLELVHKLSKVYSSKTCMIMHDNGISIKSLYKEKYKEYFKSIDIWGFRSKSIQNNFELVFGTRKKTFICYSGIPEASLISINEKYFPDSLQKFIYVGSLIKRKFPITVLESLIELYSNNSFYNLLYIGSGAEEKNIKKLIEKNKIGSVVSFVGFVPRDEIKNYLDKSECFIMVSEGEAFGLVYLEAMARGLITIGSKSEGIDGVIVHGMNGFLCSSGNKNELINLIKHINCLSTDEKQLISRNAIRTAKGMTDFKVAEKYIQTIQNF